MEAGFEEVAGFAGVGENVFVESDCAGTVAFILGDVGLFETEEEVARKLLGEAALNG